MQRFWLTATQLGLQLQPELTPLIFSRYVRERRAFSARRTAAGTGRRTWPRNAAVLGTAAAGRAVSLAA
jgi:hypothetical protein